MEKKLGIFILLGVLLVVVSLPRVAKAYDVATFRSGTFILDRQKATSTDIYKKVDYRMQKFEHGYTSTTMTDPCPKCQLMTILVEVNDKGETVNNGPARLTVMNDKVNLVQGTVSNPGNYKLSTVRNDFTLLQTRANYIWKIDYPE